MRFDELIATQAGRFTRGQAHAHGFSSYRIARRLDSGEWRPVRGRVLGLTAVPDSPDARDWEALLSAGPGAVLAGPSAARHHGMQPQDSSTCIIAPPARHPNVGRAVVLRQPLPDHDVVLRDHLLLTSSSRTVLDCAFLFDEAEALRFVERGLQRHWIDFDDLVLRVQLSTGRKGVQKLVRIVRALDSGAHSDTERRLVQGLRRAGLTGWHCNAEVCDAGGLIGIVDIAFPDLRLAVELDGRAWHVDRDRFQVDRTRQNRLVAAGWTVLRFTWEDVAYRLDLVLAEIAAALGRLPSSGDRHFR